MKKFQQAVVLSVFALLAAVAASAQSFRVQCPTSTITHPDTNNTGINSSEPAYTAPTAFASTNQTNPSQGYLVPSANVNGAIKCQQVSGGDGLSTMGDGTQTYMFSFGPLSGLSDIAHGLPGTEFPSTFNQTYPYALPAQPGEPATSDGIGPSADLSKFSFNGGIGLTPNLDCLSAPTDCNSPANGNNYLKMYPTGLDGHVDPRQIMDIAVMNGNIPAPLIAFDEDDELFLTLTNVGMIMRPDLFEQHTIHFHGYPNASSFFDGVPDASVAINIGASFTYYYLAPDAGTYFWHCHITPPEHLQMGMVGQLYVRPRQNRVTGDLYASLQKQQGDLRTACRRPGDGVTPAVATVTDILCTNPVPAVDTSAIGTATVSFGTGKTGYAYNDGDGSTYYNVEYPLQMHGFDPNFHFVGMTFNPEGFTDMKDKYFMLNGRSYPDTIQPGPMATQTTDGSNHFSQPLPSIINIPAGGRALLRISNLDVSEYQTLASLGIPMQVIAVNAKLLRDQAGNNMYYNTNSITLGGGESLDVILDSCQVRSHPSDPSSSCTTPVQTGTYYLYTPQLDHLSNDAENFGGLMTEVRVN